jgi:hypothetical protein
MKHTKILNNIYIKFKINEEILHTWQVLQLKLKVQMKWILKCRLKAAFSRISSVSVFSKNVIFLCLSGHVLSPFTPSKFKCHLWHVLQRGS